MVDCRAQGDRTSYDKLARLEEDLQIDTSVDDRPAPDEDLLSDY